MGGVRLSDVLVLLLGLVVLVTGHLKQRQNSQKCDLVCPGQPPLTLPPNFLHNCTSGSTNQTSPTSTTSSRPPSSTKRTTITTTQEESTEENEPTEPQNATARRAKHRLGRTNYHRLHRLRHKFQKGKTAFLRRTSKSRIFRHHKHLLEKARIDGCYVVCGEGPGGPPSQGDQGEDWDDPEEEEDSDHYVEGEDRPIDIIYVPSLAEEVKRPSDLYLSQNYEFAGSEPEYGLEYDPSFRGGKKLKKRKHDNHTNLEDKNHHGKSNKN